MSGTYRLNQAEIHLPRFVIRNDWRWLGLVQKMRLSAANAPPPPPPARMRPAPIRQNDFVRTQRDLVIGPHRIARGSLGTVTTIHARRPLVEVAFFNGETVSVTLAGYELSHATA